MGFHKEDVLGMSCFVLFFISRGEISSKGDEEGALSNEKREPFLDRGEWKCINTQRQMQKEHSDTRERGACRINQGGLF